MKDAWKIFAEVAPEVEDYRLRAPPHAWGWTLSRAVEDALADQAILISARI
jgi:hypothetical protein